MWLGNKGGGLGRRGREKRLESRGGGGDGRARGGKIQIGGILDFFPLSKVQE